MLAELVKAGKLPPVEQRVPQEPLVLKPLHEIGKYGGTWRRGFTGPADDGNGNRVGGGPDNLLSWTTPATRSCRPSPRAGRSQDGGKTTIAQLRKGMKWSDGEPFTADDFVFWFEDIYSNKELVPVLTLADDDQRQARQDGEGRRVHRPLRSSRSRTTAVRRLLSVSTADRRPGARSGMDGLGRLRAGPLPQAVPPEVRAPGQSSTRWRRPPASTTGSACFKFKNDWSLNPELPVVTPWKTVTPINTPIWTLERNPYSLGRHRRQPASVHRQDPAHAGREPGSGQPARHRRRVRRAGAPHGHRQAAGLPGEPAEGQLQGRPRHRATSAPTAASTSTRATRPTPRSRSGSTTSISAARSSLGIDRDQINEAFFLGHRRRPARCAPAESNKYSPGPEWRDQVVHARPQAGQRAAGQDRADQEGRRGVPPADRQRPGRLRLEITTLGGQFIQFTQISEMVRQQWKKIGIDLNVKETERTPGDAAARPATRTSSSPGATTVPTRSSPTPARLFPVNGNSWWSRSTGKWFASGGRPAASRPRR